MKFLAISHGTQHTWRTLLTALLISASAVLLMGLSTAAPAWADGPGKGTPWIVTLGDSSISGEAGRWAGNTNNSYTEVDALGSTAYDDNVGHTEELIPGCHRSQSAEGYIGHKVEGENLACSGAETSSYTSGSQFKPGLDFYNSGGHEGQALMLEKFAKVHNVTLVPIAIGGNNFNYAEMMAFCVERFFLREGPCIEQETVTKNFTAENIATQTTKIKEAILNVSEAMKKAGYTTAQYTILVQNYASPLPKGTEIRYPETFAERQEIGGCGLYNVDATGGNEVMLADINKAEFTAAEDAKLSNLKTMNVASAFNGRRLCEKGVGHLEEEGLSSWKEAGAVNKTEWVSMIRSPYFAPLTSSPYELQEDIHPNYWGQLALRDCLTKAYNGGKPIGGTCAIEEEGLNASGEPKMSLGAWKEVGVESPGPKTEYVELRSVSCFNLESSTKGLCYGVGNYKEEGSSARKTLVEKYTSSTNKWVIEKSENPAGATSSALYTIACQTESECIAVGAYTNASEENLSLGERLHSGSWTLDNPTSPPSSWDRELTGVSCPNTGECLAVGDYHTLSPGYDVALAYRWSSGTWSSPIYPLNPTGSTSDGVGVDSCPSAACVAVNRNRNSAYEYETLAESVTASNVWSMQATPSLTPATNSAFYGVSCPSSVAGCAAVGMTNKSGKEQALVEWLTTSPPWVLGFSEYPTGAQRSYLGSVSCMGAEVCMAVGGDVSSSGKEQLLVDQLYPTFALQDNPASPSGATASHLEGVSCTGEACMTVGDYTTATGVKGFAESNW